MLLSVFNKTVGLILRPLWIWICLILRQWNSRKALTQQARKCHWDVISRDYWCWRLRRSKIPRQCNCLAKWVIILWQRRECSVSPIEGIIHIARMWTADRMSRVRIIIGGKWIEYGGHCLEHREISVIIIDIWGDIPNECRISGSIIVRRPATARIRLLKKIAGRKGLVSTKIWKHSTHVAK